MQRPMVELAAHLVAQPLLALGTGLNVRIPAPATSAPQLTVLPLPAAPTQSPNPKRTVRRNGTIARLPKLERDMVNLMLRDGVPYSNIVGALDEIGYRATQRNVSNWKTRGGYREWCLEQDHAVENRLGQDNLTDFLRDENASQLAEVGLEAAATHFSELLLKPEARQLLESDPDKYMRAVTLLCRLGREIQHFQKYRDDCAKSLGTEHNPDHIKVHNDKFFARVMKTYGVKHPLDFGPESSPSACRAAAPSEGGSSSSSPSSSSSSSSSS